MNGEYYVVYTSFNGMEVVFMTFGEHNQVEDYVKRNTLVSRMTPVSMEVARVLVESLGLKVYYVPNWDVNPINYIPNETKEEV